MKNYIVKAKREKFYVTTEEIGTAHKLAREVLGDGVSFSVSEPDSIEARLIAEGKIEMRDLITIIAPPRLAIKSGW